MIAPGTQTTALMMGLIAAYFSQFGPTLGLECSPRFRRVVPMEARTRIRWEITELEDRPGLGTIFTCVGTLLLLDSGMVAIKGACQGVLLERP